MDFHGFAVRRSEDDMQRELELVHEPCGEVIVRIEEGDDFATYVKLAGSHSCPDAETEQR